MMPTMLHRIFILQFIFTPFCYNYLPDSRSTEWRRMVSNQLAILLVPLWSNSRYPFFYVFVHNRSVPDILANFNLLQTVELSFWTFISENLRVEIILTSSTAVRMKKRKLWLIYARNFLHLLL